MLPALKKTIGAATLRGTLTSALLGGTMLCGAPAVFAQDTAIPAAAPAPTDEIIVTARNKSEKLQDVPLTINVVTGDTLIKQGIRDLRDVSYKVPSMVINGGGAETLVRPSLRGLPTSEQDPTVAIFYDGAYLGGGGYANNIALLDLDRIEVVKGPVNTQYGRPGYAGAINYVTKMPSADTDGRIYMQAGNDDQIKAGFAIGLNAIPDVLMFRVAAAHESYGGGYSDKVNHLTAGGFRKNDAQVTMLFKPTDNLSFFGRAYYGHDDFDTSPQTWNDNNCGPLNTASVYTTAFPHQSFFCGKFDPKQHAIEVSPQAAKQTANSRRVWNFVGKLSYDAGIFDIASNTTYVKTTLSRFLDFYGRREGIPYIIVDTPSTGGNAGTLPGTQVGVQNLLTSFGTGDSTKDFSQELRLTSKQNQPFRYATGAYYAKAKSISSSLTGIDGSSLAPDTTIRGGAGTGGGLAPAGAPFNYLRDFLASGVGFSNAITEAATETRILSGFAGVEYDIVPTLTIGVEGRYTDLKRSITQIRSNQRTALVFPLMREASFKDWTGRGTIRWKPSEDLTLYATIANAVKPGGFNARATSAVDIAFDSEKNVTYEAGVKTSLFDRMLSFNFAAFLIDLKGIQGTGPSKDAANPGLVTTNIGQARSKGFEFDASLKPTTWLTLSGGLGYADIGYRGGTPDFGFAGTCAAIGAANCDQSRIKTGTFNGVSRTYYLLDGLRPTGSSKWTGSLGADINAPISDKVDFFAGAKYRYQSKQFANQQNVSWWGALNRVDVRAGIQWQQLRVTAFVDNLTDNRTPESVGQSTYLNDLSPGYFGQLPAPRRYGLGLDYNF